MAKDSTYIRSVSLLGWKEFLAGYGVDIHPLLDEVGIHPKVLSRSNEFYSYIAGNELLRMAAEKTGQPDLGLKFVEASRPDYPFVGPVFFFAQFEKNNRTWLKTYQRYLSYHTNGVRLETVTDDPGDLVRGIVHHDPFINVCRTLEEVMMVGITEIARVVIDDEKVNPAYVCLRFPKPRDVSSLEQVFRCPIHYGCKNSEIAYPIEFLDYPIGSKWRVMKPFVNFVVESFAGREVSRLGSVSQETRTVIPMLFGTIRCNQQSVAEIMGMHPKSLQRQLHKEGESFSSLHQQVKEATAKQLVAESNIPLQQIAAFLGYSGATAFSLAFERWAAKTPGRFRREYRESRSR